MARWHSCNVFQVAADARRLWQFDARNGEFKLEREHTVAADETLPPHLTAKSWRSLWQPRLNVALLPPDSVFLRVVHLPKGSPDETLAMVELQLEKLSPIPLTQVVWTLHLLPDSAAELQTVIVVLAERRAVEEFLGQLEGQGYLADRLELSVLDELQATPVNENGAWIYPGAAGGPFTALVAWWYDGVLQNLNFLTLPATGDRAAGLKDQLLQMAWAGELEGWLKSPPTWHLVTDPAAAHEWESPLREGLEQPIVVTAPLGAAERAGLTAKRAAEARGKTSLLPTEFATRYRQQFVDRLWIRGLAAVGVVYAIGVAIYFAALSFQLFRVGRVESQVKELSQSYTNAIQLRDRLKVLTERQELKFASLDCWRTIAELMPETLTLEGFNFTDGRKLMLSGTAPADAMNDVLDFNSAMRKAEADGQPLFDADKGAPPSSRLNPGGATVGWNFTLELKRSEVR